VIVQQKRRELLRAALGIGAALPALRIARAADDPKAARPQAGDHFVYFSGDKKGQVVKPDDLPLGGPQVVVWPVDGATDTVRDGSRLNQVLLIRLPEEELSDETKANAAEGVVAYSAACSHQACPVSMWKKDKNVFYCACHGSEYDPRDAARIVHGPAKRRLAMLPLQIEGGELTAAGPFSGPVGAVKR
jgi:Rieske Fe-S protein